MLGGGSGGIQNDNTSQAISKNSDDKSQVQQNDLDDDEIPFIHTYCFLLVRKWSFNLYTIVNTFRWSILFIRVLAKLVLGQGADKVNKQIQFE